MSSKDLGKISKCDEVSRKYSGKKARKQTKRQKEMDEWWVVWKKWVKVGLVLIILTTAGVVRWVVNRVGETQEVLRAPSGARVEVPEVPFTHWVASKKLVALTFDDGPEVETTPRLLDVLKARNVRATFFVMGRQVAKYPEVVKRTAEEGHEVGAHAWSHVPLTRLSASNITAEMAGVNDAVTAITGVRPTLMRPPYGAMNGRVRANVGMPLILWSVDTLDWKYQQPEVVWERALASVEDGAIILMHDVYPTTVDAVDKIIEDLRVRGYELVTISELARIRGRKLVAGESYFHFRP